MRSYFGVKIFTANGSLDKEVVEGAVTAVGGFEKGGVGGSSLVEETFKAAMADCASP